MKARVQVGFQPGCVTQMSSFFRSLLLSQYHYDDIHDRFNEGKLQSSS